jgi:hypothetical protein
MSGDAMMQEIQPNRDEKEDDRHWQVDDINIPLVAVSVAFFGVLLSVTIIGLQAWFYNARAHETAIKTLPQEDSRTELGALLEKQRKQLTAPAGEITPATASAPATGNASASAPVRKFHIPIEAAMDAVSRQYAEGTR